MKKIAYYLSSSALLAFPMLVGAQGFAANGGQIGTLLGNLLTFFNNVLIPFILGLGFLLFVWGMFQYFIAGGANDEAKEKGKSLMLYATLGFVIIIIFWGVINLITSSTGFAGGTLQTLPSAVPIGG
jgi:hypothetical protein